MRFWVGLSIIIFSRFASADSPLDQFHKLAEQSVQTLSRVLADAKPEFNNTVLNSSHCIAVFPSYTQAGFLWHKLNGTGLLSCRIQKGWSTPVFVSTGNRGFGFFIGVKKSEMIVPLSEPVSAELLKEEKVDLQRIGSVKAYSRPGNGKVLLAHPFNRGVFSFDKKANAQVYGSYTTEELLRSNLFVIPGWGDELVRILSQLSPRN
jgi:lipid-binding SYLF domain-containing protein